MFKKIGFIFLFACFFTQANSQNIFLFSDSAKISLITNGQSDEEVYSLFGHTAIRVNDPVRGIDWVYNYGIFDFDAPFFLWRFIRGNADFMLNTNEFINYTRSYKERGVAVTEQELNLTSTEKQRILNALEINTFPENRYYIYNFFYDNCSTRPRDIITNNVEGKVIFAPTNVKQTFRDLIWECVHIQAWTNFGIDIVIGADADKVITDREKYFLPKYLFNAFDKAVIQNTDGTERALVHKTNTILESNITLKPTANYPLIVACILLLITIFISYLSYIKNKVILGKIFDFVLFSIAGLVGCVIFFLMFFSVLPSVDNNWNIVWANPLQLLIALVIFIKPFKKLVNYYHILNSIILIAFLLMWFFIPQQLQLAFIPIILSLIIRSVVNILQARKSK